MPDDYTGAVILTRFAYVLNTDVSSETLHCALNPEKRDGQQDNCPWYFHSMSAFFHSEDKDAESIS
jgi:hypothetical protein